MAQERTVTFEIDGIIYLVSNRVFKTQKTVLSDGTVVVVAAHEGSGSVSPIVEELYDWPPEMTAADIAIALDLPLATPIG